MVKAQRSPEHIWTTAEAEQQDGVGTMMKEDDFGTMMKWLQSFVWTAQAAIQEVEWFDFIFRSFVRLI